MKTLAAVVGIGLNVFCVVVGFFSGLILAGWGICAVDFSWGLVGGVATVAFLLSLAAGAAIPKCWWLSAILFSIPICLPFVTREWSRGVASVICIVTAFVAARLGRYWKLQTAANPK